MRSCNHKILLFIEVSLFPEFGPNKMSTSDCVQCPPYQLSQCHEKSLLTITVQFVRLLVDLSGKLLIDIVGAGRRGAEFLTELLTVVFKAIKYHRFIVFLGIVLHGLMWFLSACFMALLFNDISFLLQNDKTSIEQNHNHILMGTHISRAIYSVFTIILTPYWTWNGWKMADQVPDPTDRQSDREFCNRILEGLQSEFQAGEALGSEVNPNSDSASREDLGSGMGASSPVAQDVESGGGTSTPVTSTAYETFHCIFTLEKGSKKLAIKSLQRFPPDLILKGSTVLYKRFEINTQQPGELANNVSQIVASMRLAHDVDEDCVLQLGSSAIFKYTATGPKMWILQKDWTPAIIDICRQWSFFDCLLGHPATWVIKGFNLQGATLRVASIDTSEDLKVLIVKHENGVDIIICEEPHILRNLASTFQEKQFISAFKNQELEEGVTVKLRSEAKAVQRAYWISLVGAVIPGRWITIISVALSLLVQVYSNSKFGRKLFFSKLLSNYGIVVHVYKLFTPTCTFVDPTYYPAFMPTCEHTSETHQTWTHLWTGLAIYVKVYLVYLFSLLFILSWKLLLPARAPSGGPQSLVTPSAAPVSIDSPRAIDPPPGVTQLNNCIWELHSPPGIPAMEIIFFPGLQLEDFNNSFWKTWASTNDEHVIWPKEWLSRRFPTARILCVSYNFCAAEIAGQPDEPDIDNLGENLVRDIILDENYNIGHLCPVVLVGHSLGGTVIKDFVSSAIEICESGDIQGQLDRISKFLGNISGIFYYAAPNGGSRIAELASQIQSANPILELLRKIDTASGSINKEFRQRRVDWPSSVVAEGCKIHYGAFDAKVVDEASARHDVDFCYTHPTANHLTVCKADSIEDVAIEELIQFIEVKLTSFNLLDFCQRGTLRRSEIQDLFGVQITISAKGEPPNPKVADLVSDPEEQSAATAITPPSLSKVGDKGDIEHLELVELTKHLNEASQVSTIQPWVESSGASPIPLSEETKGIHENDISHSQQAVLGRDPLQQLRSNSPRLLSTHPAGPAWIDRHPATAHALRRLIQDNDGVLDVSTWESFLQ